MGHETAAFKEKIKNFGQGEQGRIEKALSLAASDAGLDRSLGIASILIDLNLDADTVTAALLLGTTDNAHAEFGGSISLLVEGVRKIADISAKNKTIHEAENIRKMLFAMAADIRVIFIKLAERLRSMRTLDGIPAERQKPIAQECLDIYAPLADRLGISWIKDELEDLSLKYLNREAYLQIKDIVAE